MPTNFDLQKQARELAREQKRQAEIRRGREIVARKMQEQAQDPRVAMHYLAKEFDPTYHGADKPVEGVPGDFVSDYNKQLWARNKNREDFK